MVCKPTDATSEGAFPPQTAYHYFLQERSDWPVMKKTASIIEAFLNKMFSS